MRSRLSAILRMRCPKCREGRIFGPKGQTNGNDPIYSCTPTGIPRILFFPQPIQIMQNNGVTLQFFEREHAWREIWTDGRQHPKDPDATYMGDSIGRWEGDTFIVDSVGFNDKSWLDFYGSPHSEQMHLVGHLVPSLLLTKMEYPRVIFCIGGNKQVAQCRIYPGPLYRTLKGAISLNASILTNTKENNPVNGHLNSKIEFTLRQFFIARC